jgi:hypothetical protein
MDIIEKHERVVFVIWEPLRSVLFQKYKRIGGHCSAMVGCLELKTIKNCLPLGEIVVYVPSSGLKTQPKSPFYRKYGSQGRKNYNYLFNLLSNPRELHG